MIMKSFFSYPLSILNEPTFYPCYPIRGVRGKSEQHVYHPPDWPRFNWYVSVTVSDLKSNLKLFGRQCFILIKSGVNFTIVLRAADPKSAKKIDGLTVFFPLSEYVCKKLFVECLWNWHQIGNVLTHYYSVAIEYQAKVT